MEVPADAPQHCPGVSSESAGKASSCEGCPNQTLCASGVSKSFTDGLEKVAKRLSSVKNKIAILSGKGGVGKSTFTSILARHLASMNDGKHNVGVVDIDICGPSQPRLMGLENEDVHMSGSGWCPVYVEENLAVMSVGFLLKDPDEAIIWRGNRKTNMIQDLLGEVDWGNEELDYLLIDTPPGTSDEHISTVGLLKKLGLYAIIVTTPQEVALLDVRKEIDFCRKVNIKILGVVENMSPFLCPHCNGESDIFSADTGGVIKMCSDLNVRFLGKMPLDPKLTRACDEGSDLSQISPEHPTIKSLTNITNNILEALSDNKLT